MRATRASGIAGLAGIMSAVWDLSREACSCMLVQVCFPCWPPACLQLPSLHCSTSACCCTVPCGHAVGYMLPCSQER